MRKSRAFTLLEIMIVLLILGSLGGILLFNAGDFLRSFRKSHEISRLVDELSLTQNYALSYGGDIRVIITKEEKGFRFERKTDEPIKAFPHLSRPISFPVLLINKERYEYVFHSDGRIIPKFNLPISLEETVVFAPPQTFNVKKKLLNN